MKTMIGDRLDRVKATRPPSNICTWCTHDRTWHHAGRQCFIDKCVCLRFTPHAGTPTQK